MITGDLLREPRRVGKPLQRELAGRWAARRGSYRVLYTFDDQAGIVTVLAAEHRWVTLGRRGVLGPDDSPDDPDDEEAAGAGSSRRSRALPPSALTASGWVEALSGMRR